MASGKHSSGKLGGRRRLFALEYLANGLNAAAAYRAAYSTVSPGTATTNGGRLLRNAEVRRFVETQIEKRARKLELKADRVLEELARIALLDPADFFDQDGRLLAPRDMPENTRRALAAFEEEALFDNVQTGTGPKGGIVRERLQVGVVRKVKWHGKVQALELAMRHLGLLKDEVEVKASPSYEHLVLLAQKMREVRLREAGGQEVRA